MRKFLYAAVVVFGLGFGQAGLAVTQNVVSGSVTANGSPVNSGWVEVYGANNTPYAGAEIVSGQYTITRDSTDTAWTNGAYTVRVFPDTATYGGFLVTSTTINYNSAPLQQNITLGSVSKQIQVNVVDANGVAVSGEVLVTGSGGGNGLSEVRNLQNGTASFTVNPVGQPFIVNVNNCVQNQQSNCQPWYYDGEPVTVTFSQPAATAETQQVTMTVQETTSTITGQLAYEGQGFRGYIDFYNADHLFRGWADDTGTFTVYGVPGVYNIDLLPQQSQSNPDVVRYYIAETAFTITTGANDLGTLNASYESSTISAVLQDANGNDLGTQATGMVANFWLDNGGEWRKIIIQGDQGASIGSEAHEGTYRISVYDPSQNFFPLQASQTITVNGANQEKEVIFTMLPAAGTVSFTLEHADGSNAPEFNSFLNCWDETQQWGTGVNLTRGTGDLNVLAGTYSCNAVTPKNADYSMQPEIDLVVSDGQDQTVTATLVEHDAVVSGTLLDQNGDPVIPSDTGDPMTVLLDSENFGRFEATVNSDGTWSANVPADTFTINPTGGDVVPVLGLAEQTVTVASGATASATEVNTFTADDTITTTVTEPDGSTPLPFTAVSCSYLPDGEKGDFAGGRVVTVSAETDENGAVSIPVVTEDHGVALNYNCGISVSENQDFITPATQEDIEPGADLDFTVFEPDATIAVTYDAPADAELANTQCQAWVADGTGMVNAVDSDGDGTVNLAVSQEAGKDWKVSCSAADGETWFTPTEPTAVIVNQANETATVPIEENTLQAVPDATSMVFDGSGEHSVVLDTVTMAVPANTVPTDGDVTITVTPSPNDIPQNEENLVLGMPVNIKAFDSNGSLKPSLNQEVTVTLPYNETVLEEAGILETDLAPKFFDESTGSWQTMGGFAVDTTANMVTFNTDHFTQFALLYDNRIAGAAPGRVKNVNVKKVNQVNWKKVNTSTSYQLQLRNKKNKIIKTVKNITKIKYTLKAKWVDVGKRYKVRVRAVGSNGLYGAWSKYDTFVAKAKTK
ncbi:MAG: hypothetical protein HYV33_04930 [Candidatus Kerfeldbacteria bacterium]|nr:hypothetical protein [Candidatus Kerfeldbacteria bacterium]